MVFTPIRIALSRPAQRAYLTAILAIFAGFTLLATAILGYSLFYWSYVPRSVFERSIHLQFDQVYDHNTIVHNAHPYPYGTIALNPDAVNAQRYDVVIEVTLPRTPENADAGNFMLEAVMFGPRDKVSSSSSEIYDMTKDETLQSHVLARSRRPAILPYRSRLVDLAHRAFQIHWFIMGWKQEEDILRVVMFENVYFGKGRRNTPTSMSLELQSTHRLQTYNCKAIFHARFRGLRWLMYNHRIFSAAVFISGFWLVELLFAAIAWAAVVVYLLAPPEETPSTRRKRISEKGEGANGVHTDDTDAEDPMKFELSDTERTFPTPRGQPTLQYSSPTTKRENSAERLEQSSSSLMAIPPFSAAVEADDEDDDTDFFDSGIGTSLDSSSTSRRDSVRKRRGRASSRDRP